MNRIGNLNAVDVGKFFMAFVVIAIHTHPFEGLEQSVFITIYFLSCHCAVPFFFLSTGYLLARKLKSKNTIDEKNKL